MAWLKSPQAAEAAKAAATRSADCAVRTVLCKPLRDPLRNGCRVAVRGKLVHAAGRRGARSMGGSSAGMSQARFPTASEWLIQEAMGRNTVKLYNRAFQRISGIPVQSLYEQALRRSIAAQAANWRLRVQRRLVSLLGGLSVGMGVACLSVAALDKITQSSEALMRQPHLASADALELAPAPSGPLLDLLASNLVRKNSKLCVDEAYTFAAGPPLGEGSYGVVHRATHNKTGLERAVKRIDKENISDVAMLSREVEALRVMDHPNIARLIEYFETDRQLWLVMELCRGEELCDYVIRSTSGLPEAQASRLMAHMLKATLHCHQKSIIHRDLKPENFIFKDASGPESNTLKLVDFGFCMPAPDAPPSLFNTGFLSKLTTPRREDEYSGGTLLYRSPESLRGAPPAFDDDSWSLGVIFHILLTGQFPFSTNDDACFEELCNRGKLRKDVETHLSNLTVSADAADLASKLLAPSGNRISVESALNHPFITSQPSNAPDTAVASQWTEAKGFYDRFERFQRSPRLRRIAAAATARLLVDDTSGQRTEATSAAFSALDKHGTGHIAQKDLKELFMSAGLMPPASWFDSLVGAWPALAQPQGISYNTFVATTLDDILVSGDNRLCRAVFDHLDAGRDGTLDAVDLHKRLGLSTHEAEQVVCEALNQLSGGDGSRTEQSLSFPAFLSLMRTAPLP